MAYRTPVEGVDYVFIANMNEVRLCGWETKTYKALIVEKIKPRRIVLENAGIGKPRIGDYIYHRGGFSECDNPGNFGSNHQIWRIVEE